MRPYWTSSIRHVVPPKGPGVCRRHHAARLPGHRELRAPRAGRIIATICNNHNDNNIDNNIGSYIMIIIVIMIIIMIITITDNNSNVSNNNTINNNMLNNI